MMRPFLLSSIVALGAAENTLIITAGMQTGFFKWGDDIGAMNPHDYRPNEYVTNDFIYEGLVAWDGEHPDGEDGLAGTSDDYVKPSLARSWEENLVELELDPNMMYTIKFYLEPNVTFHDGTEWNATVAALNFNQIMGGYGEQDGLKAMKGMHDWFGFTQSLNYWSKDDDANTFTLHFDTYYEAALRELTFIRPFRMISLASFPDMAAMELSHNAWRNGAPRTFKDSRCNKTGIGVMPLAECTYTLRGVSNPIGTGPYMVIDKLIKDPDTQTERRIPAAEFNETCYVNDACTYNGNEYVAEVLFQKFEGSRKNPVYDYVIFRSYESRSAIADALRDGSLDIAYGVATTSASAFLSIATEEGSADGTLVAHQSPTGLNTRLIVLNSGAQLDTIEKRKLIMGIIANARADLYDGALAEEYPMDTLFDPALPYCSVLSTLSSSAELASDTTATPADITAPLRFMYQPAQSHGNEIASQVYTKLTLAGIAVELIPVDKATYDSMNCVYLGNPDNWADPNDTQGTGNGTIFPYYYSYHYEGGAENNAYVPNNWHTWDIAYSETWGPPYDPQAKLWDMTHGLYGWCSAETDAPAVSNMETMPYIDFVGKVRELSTIIDYTERDAAYAEVLTTLHTESIFLPLSEKRNTAVVNKRVAGFEFGYMEYDMPLAPLIPADLTYNGECGDPKGDFDGDGAFRLADASFTAEVWGGLREFSFGAYQSTRRRLAAAVGSTTPWP